MIRKPFPVLRRLQSTIAPRANTIVPITQKNPFYITTPIFYPNAEPHLGHLYSILLCDVRHRWEKLQSRPSFFTTGTDEHGLKIQTAAANMGKDPKEFVDNLVERFVDLAGISGVEYDRFIRTSDPDHVQAVKHFWNVLKEKGWIYEGEHKGWYCVSDETFYPETQVANKDGKHYSLETGNEVTFTSEKNYFFKLSEFQERLINHIESNPSFIVPNSRRLDLLRELKAGPLEDLSISRPSSRLTWGIRVPDDDSQTIYVWIDALVNYITSAGYPSKLSSSWPATHLIGKDIIRFHCIYWPALLLAAGIELPHQVIVHGHWLSEGYKMSKSRGNVVNPRETIGYYGSDAVRIYLCENSVLNTDGNFNEIGLSETRDQLVDKFCNLTMRACGKKFNIERALSNVSQFPEVRFTANEDLNRQYDEVVTKINALKDTMDPYYRTYQYAQVTHPFWSVISEANTFVQNATPWKTESQLHQDKIIHLATEAARISAILVSPMVPTLSKRVLDRLAVKERGIEMCEFGKDLSYGAGANRAGDYPMTKVAFRLEKK